MVEGGGGRLVSAGQELREASGAGGLGEGGRSGGGGY